MSQVAQGGKQAPGYGFNITEDDGKNGYPTSPPPPYPQSQYAQPPPPPPPVRVAIPQNVHDAERGQVNTGGNNTGGGNWGDFSSLSDKVVRIKFIRKVYAILTLQLIITFGIVAIFVFVEPVKAFAKTSAGLGLYIASYVIFIVLIIVLSCCQCVQGLRKFPFNYLLLLAVTLTMTYMLGMISAYHSTQSVLIAIAVTFAVVLAVTLFAMQTKIDFTNCWLLAFCLAIALLFVGITIGVASRYNLILQAVYGGIGAVIMAIFLAIDTQLVMGGKRKYAFSPEDYINAALQLYLDICYMFLYILSLVSGSSGGK